MSCHQYFDGSGISSNNLDQVNALSIGLQPNVIVSQLLEDVGLKP